MSKNETKWSCSHCTYDNFLASNKCSLCSHPRGSEVIQLPSTKLEEPLVIHNHDHATASKSYSSLIICPPSCSSKLDEKDERESDLQTFSVSSTQEKHQSSPNSYHANNSLMDCVILPWTCSVCTFINVRSNDQCSQCLSSKANQEEPCLGENQNACFSKSSNSKTDKWQCNICTYENWNASKKCVICHNKKGAGNDSVGKHVLSENLLSNNMDILTYSGQNKKSEVQKTQFQSDSQVNLSKSKSKTELDNQVTANNSENLSRLHDMNASKEIYGNNINRKSRSPSLSSNSSDDAKPAKSTLIRNSRQRRKKDNQPSSSTNEKSGVMKNSNSGEKLSRSNSSNHLYSPGCLEVIDNRSFKNRTRNLNWLFLKACIGIVDGNAEAVDAYLTHGGNIARCLTFDEINSLNRPSAFDVGHTLVHLAIRFQRHSILALLLNPEIAPRGFKRNPSHLSPDIADLIRREIMMSIRTIKGDFHCRFLSECCTFQLPIEICDLPSAIQQLLFNELLDQDVQKELEEESAINWSPSLLRIGDSNNRLYALWNRSAGDCLLDSVLQATWGVFDRDNVLRTAMSESLQDCGTSLYSRWKDWELQQADILGYSLTEQQCLEDWSIIHSLAQQPGASLEHCHIFVLSHILRRPVIIYGIKYLKSFRGDALGFAKFQGVYLPFLWDQSFCYTSPIALGYTRGHFTALVTMENDRKGHRSSARQRCALNAVKTLPLVDSDGKVLPIHFTLKGEGKSEKQRKEILQEWLDCYVTDDGLLMARQRPGKRPPSLTRMIDTWLDHYRHLAFKRLGEEGDTDDDDE